MIITYDDTIPPPFLPIVKERFDKILGFFPTWCHEIIIEYSNDSSHESALSCKSDYPYRYIKIFIYDYWFQERDWDILLFHELMHSILTPLTLKIERAIDSYITDQDTKKYISQELIDAEEAVCQDLAKLSRDLTKYRNNDIMSL